MSIRRDPFRRAILAEVADATIERGVWLQIEAYRGFYDVPRILIARATDGRRWLLRCLFDPVANDYESDFTVLALPSGCS